MFCPNYKNKEVFDGFNEIVELYGGRPMTEEEFQSKELRNLRTGLDFYAVEAAYRLYNRNGGNFLDKTPNGKDSILFNTLLDYFNGDRKKALKAKADVYSNKFFNWFGDWTGNFNSEQFDEETKRQISLIFKRIPKLSEIGTEELYAKYIQTIFPESQDKSIYWHGSNSDFSEGFKSAKREEGSGAPETKKRNDFYLAKQAWSVLQYVNGVNRKSVDKNGFSHWNKLWWEFKEIMSNGRRENNDWKDLVINEETVRQAIPNKNGIFNRDKGGDNGKWLKERKADYGYENKSDKEFFEEILGIKWGEDTFNTWTKRNAEIFKSLLETENGIYPAVINTINPIREKGQDTYYEEHRGLFTKADADGNDAILGSETDNEFGSDVAVVLRDNSNVHFLGTQEDMDAFSKFVNRQNVSKVVDANGEPLVVWHGTPEEFDEFNEKATGWHTRGLQNILPGFFFTPTKRLAEMYYRRNRNSYELLSDELWEELYRRHVLPVYLNIKTPHTASQSGFEQDFSNVELGDFFKQVYENSKDSSIDGYILDVVDTDEFAKWRRSGQKQYVAKNPNQIKHVLNLGSWSEKDNIYSTPSENLKENLGIKDHGYSIKLNIATTATAFGKVIALMLKEGKTVSSKLIMKYISSNLLLSDDKILLAKILSEHDIPIVYGTLKHGKLAATITDSNGGSVIVVNPDYVNTVSILYLSDTILHEVIHAVTVNAIDRPQTKEERNFARTSRATYQLFDKIVPLEDRLDMYSGGYVMENEKEFASIFMTDENAREYLYQKAREYDKMSSITKFINSILSLFINQNIFTKSAVSQLDEYKKQMMTYLANRPTVDYSNISSEKLIKLVFDRMSKNSFYGDQFQTAIEDAVLQDKLLQINYLSAPKELLVANFTTLSRTLMTRLHVIKRSNLGKAEISRQSQLIESLASMLMNEDYAIKLLALRALANLLGPLIREDFDMLKTLPELDAEQYMTITHTNVGTYKKLAVMASEILSNGSEVSKIILASYTGKSVDTEEGREEYDAFKRRIIEDIIRLKDTFDTIRNLSKDCEVILQRIRKKSVKTLLSEIGNAVKDPFMEDYIQHLEIIDYDTSSATKSLGAADSAEDNALRALAYLVNLANTKTLMELVEVASLLTKCLKNIDRKKLQLLYEKDSKGRTTGYLIRKRNYGQFYDDYDEFIVSLNREISRKYKIKLGDDNRIAPVEKEARYEWNHKRNEWLSKRCHRRYINRYYEALEKLSAEAVLRMATINNQIYQINMLPGVIQENGKPDYSVLTDEQWDELQNLITKKKFLRKEVDEWGHLKCDAELEIAHEIDEYYKTIYPEGSAQMLQDWDAWNDAKQKVFEECGGQVEFDKMKRGEEHSFDKNRWDKWNSRNSKLEFVKDVDGKPLVFKRILFDLNNAKPYYGAEEEAIAKEINNLISTFYGTNMIINDKAITKAMLNKIAGLISKQVKLRKQAIKNNPALEKLSAKYGAIFNSYIEFVTTDRFRKLEADAMEKSWETGDFDEFLYYSLMQQYGTVIEDWDTAEVLGFRPFRWFTKMQAKDVDRWMILTPGDAYNDVENSSSLKNSKFDESEGVSFIPFTEGEFKKYDNSRNYALVHKTEGKESLYDKNLAEMYDTIVKIMELSNDKLINRVHTDKFLLPQISGTLYKRLTSNKKEGGNIHRWWRVFTEWIGEKVGLRKSTTLDDTIFGELNTNEDLDETGTEVGTKYVNLKDIGLLKDMPDGRSMHIIPQYFTKRKSPEYISKDLLGIVFSYAQMASNYKNKLDIKDKCEMIVDQIGVRTYKKTEPGSSQASEITGKLTKTYAMAQKFLEMNLYDIKRDKGVLNTPNPNITWQYTHALDLLKNYTTANNLGLNPKVSIVGILTSQYNHFINSLCGNGYSFEDATRGGFETLSRIAVRCITNGSYIGEIGSDDKLMVIDRFYNVQDLLNKEVTNSHVNRLQKAARENYTFGMMSVLDFISKTSIALSVLYGTRYIDGEFLTKDLIYLNAAKLPKNERDKYIEDKLKKFKSKDVKKNYNLYHLITVKDGEFYIADEKIRKAYTDSIHHMVKSRIEKLAERADGMATSTQKAAITQSQLGALVLIHRQYLPLMIQERFGKEVFDYDMSMMKNGQLNSLFRLCTQIAQTSILAGAGVGALGSFLLLRSIPGASLFITAGTLLGAWYSSNHKSNKTTKQVWNEFFNDDSTAQSYVKSMYHRRIRKQIITELISYQLLSALIGLLCAKADDDRQEWWLQFAALCARQFQWEAYTPYRFDDVLNNFKTVSAATGTIDYLQNSMGGLGSLILQSINYALYNTLGGADSNNSLLKSIVNDNVDTKVKSGVYKKWDKPMKSLYKTTPIHNLYQQGFYAPIWRDVTELPTIDSGGAVGPYKMRTYTENQIMRINE